jgi:hypothetical protein
LSENQESGGDPSAGGRPEWMPSKAQRRQVSVAAGAGMSHEEIAIAMGVSRGTLEKHCAAELNEGACKRRFEVMNAMYRTARKGNVAAQKAYLAAGEPRTVVPQPEPPAADDKPPLGKKEQANVDARTAAEGSEWHDLLPRSGRSLQ